MPPGRVHRFRMRDHIILHMPLAVTLKSAKGSRGAQRIIGRASRRGQKGGPSVRGGIVTGSVWGERGR